MEEPYANEYYFTISECAWRLRMSEHTIRRWVTGGLLPAERVGLPPGRYRIRAVDLDAFVRKHR